MVKYLTLESAYRTIFIIFYLEMYMDLRLGGMLNTENDYLLDKLVNWGLNGDLTKSDQIAIILGNIIYICCVLFPFVVIYLLDNKYNLRYR